MTCRHRVRKLLLPFIMATCLGPGAFHIDWQMLKFVQNGHICAWRSKPFSDKHVKSTFLTDSTRDPQNNWAQEFLHEQACYELK